MKVLLIIAAVIVLILLIPLKARIIYDGGLTLRVSVCGIWKTIVPKAKKPVKLGRWTKRAVLRREEKERRKAAKKRLADEKKKVKAEAKKRKKDSEKPDKPDAAEGHKEKSGRGLGYYMKFVRVGVRVLKKLLKKLRKNIDVDIRRLWIRVAAAEADKTAFNYGLISGGVSNILAFLGEKGHVRYLAPKGFDAVYIEADFVSGRMEFVVDVEIGSHVGRLLGIVNGVIASAAAGLFREFIIDKDR